MDRLIIFIYNNALIILLISLAPIVLWSGNEPTIVKLTISEPLPLFIGIIAILKSYKNFP
jgi:hypothetical protein